MHRCAVHKLTNRDIRLMPNTRGAVTSRQQVRDMVTQIHLCKTTLNNNTDVNSRNSNVMSTWHHHFHGELMYMYELFVCTVQGTTYNWIVI